MQKLALALATAALLSPAALAQFTLVAPNGYAAAEGNSNNIYPWGRGTASMRVQNIYDSTTFTAQGVTSPIIISRLRFRADAIATSWAGGTYPQVQIDMSTCPVDYTAVSGTFASNHGANLTTVLNGPVAVIGGTGSNPGPWYIDIPLSTNFIYDPTTGGDLNVDIMLNGSGWSGGTAAFDNVDAAGVPPPLGTRVFDATTNTPNGSTGSIGVNYVAVCEFT